MKFKQIVATVVISTVTAAASIFVYSKYFQPRQAGNFQNGSDAIPVNYARFMPGADKGANVTPPTDFTTAAKTAVPGVVHIKTKINPRQVTNGNNLQRRRSILQDLFGDEFFGDEFNGGGDGRRYYVPGQMASGSGVLISDDGYIVTNNHVIADADEITVSLSNENKTYKATLVGTDPSTDLAVIKITAKGLPYLLYGNSDNVEIGQWVLAVGYPLNLDATVTAGIVSAKSRSIGINKSGGKINSAIESFIQTDAAVNQGNSGGALVNTAGELVGVNSAIASPTGSYAGYSYAIPVNLIKKVVNDILKYGNVQRAYLGVRYASPSAVAAMSDEQLKEIGISRDVNGVQITDVMANSSAAVAGLRSGDVITRINGVNIPGPSQMSEQVARYKPGDKISITYLRGSKEITAENVVLRNLKGNTDLVKITILDRLGADFTDLDKEEAAQMGIRGGVKVGDIGTGIIKKQTTMLPGFVILKAGNTTITSTDMLSSILDKQKAIQLIGFYPQRGSNIYYYNINTGGGTENL
ncbi:trypsin-like peptidase domain-containing protein [Chitinophaga nivalis]|uniref:Trypsin-like peptidase domain-containing protein n=1 Tax=Chitinophaga nivalis TaxID=2991709 RepID=A0ABT3IQR4_9BACT|nr:trypsin-like peptidase domain-containing protein [Chitinophaga nivalis]MCW3464032.1 trypsin-like peptidase domain-containing protein [Chitinophaga nivalis]MCW3486278.1 trypsin-like peptidase domain-containing protein [Chitinophaga nivalis]